MNEKRVAFVTGGSRGIGAAIVRRLAKDGFHVVAVARNAEKLNELCQRISGEGGSAEAVVCDIADSKGLAEAIEKTAEKHGRIDVLVNNAGITKDGLILLMDDEDFDSVIDTNLKSAFVSIRSAARPMMRAKGGRIINISSVAGVAGDAGEGKYAARKAGGSGGFKSGGKEMSGGKIKWKVGWPGGVTTGKTEVLDDPREEVGE